jgi:hypothetical protein
MRTNGRRDHFTLSNRRFSASPPGAGALASTARRSSDMPLRPSSAAVKSEVIGVADGRRVPGLCYLRALMCPLCREHDGKPCTLAEREDGRIVCSCGKHSWPNAGALEETCRQMALTITGQVHNWTQSL